MQFKCRFWWHSTFISLSGLTLMASWIINEESFFKDNFLPISFILCSTVVLWHCHQGQRIDSTNSASSSSFWCFYFVIGFLDLQLAASGNRCDPLDFVCLLMTNAVLSAVVIRYSKLYSNVQFSSFIHWQILSHFVLRNSNCRQPVWVTAWCSCHPADGRPRGGWSVSLGLAANSSWPPSSHLRWRAWLHISSSNCAKKMGSCKPACWGSTVSVWSIFGCTSEPQGDERWGLQHVQILGIWKVFLFLALRFSARLASYCTSRPR